MNDKRYEKYLERTKERRNMVIKAVEQIHDDANEILPAVFTVEFNSLPPEQILILNMSIDLFWKGYEFGREY